MAFVMSPEARLRARIGGLALAAQRNSRAYTAKARASFLNRFEREVDPDSLLPSAERQRRAAAAKKLYFARLALRSAKARRRRQQREQVAR